MKLINVAYFLELGRNAGAAQFSMHFDPLFEKINSQAPEVVNEKERAQGMTVYKYVEEMCIDFGFIGPLATTRRLQTAVGRFDLLKSDLSKLEIELHGRLSDEFMERVFFALSTDETEHFNNWSKGWEEIIGRFPDSIRDIEEARKCFALSRYAASIFHSLQIVEFGLIELGRILVTTDHQTGWNATTKRIKAILDIKHPNRTAFQQRHSKSLEQIDGTVEALKNAWRNKISHAQDKLVLLHADFTPAIAEEILSATKSFMRRLAVDIPTFPDPDA